MRAEVIMHYASPYYDPEKAHEYYEAHKKLKGRHSTAGLNEKGRETASYVRQRLAEERKQRIETSRQTMTNKVQSSRTSLKNKIASNRDQVTKTFNTHKANTQSKIDKISEKLKGLSTEERKGPKGEALRNDIAKLRESNGRQRKLLQNALADANAKLRSSHKMNSESARQEHKTNVEQYKKDYENKYERELNNIRSDSSMVTKKKKKKSK